MTCSYCGATAVGTRSCGKGATHHYCANPEYCERANRHDDPATPLPAELGVMRQGVLFAEAT